MAFSSPLAFMEMASDGHPIVDRTQFDEVISKYGWNVLRRRKATAKDCPCYDEITKIVDPNCAACEGTGSVLGYQDEVVRTIMLFDIPNGYWALGDVHTIAGDFERIECAGFFSGVTDIQIGDIILFTSSAAYSTDINYEEFTIYNLEPRMVGDSGGLWINIFTRADMRKPTYPFSGAFRP